MKYEIDKKFLKFRTRSLFSSELVSRLEQWRLERNDYIRKDVLSRIKKYYDFLCSNFALHSVMNPILTLTFKTAIKDLATTGTLFQ